MTELTDEVKRMIIRYVKQPLKQERDRLNREIDKCQATLQSLRDQRDAVKEQIQLVNAEIADPPEPEPIEP